MIVKRGTMSTLKLTIAILFILTILVLGFYSRSTAEPILLVHNYWYSRAFGTTVYSGSSAHLKWTKGITADKTIIRLAKPITEANEN